MNHLTLMIFINLHNYNEYYRLSKDYLKYMFWKIRPFPSSGMESEDPTLLDSSEQFPPRYWKWI
jgi:hypothetical protein